MRIIDRGEGPAVVVVPGVQGRWEWMAPTVDALAARSRVITFSLADEPGCLARFDPDTGFWCYVDQIRDAMDQAGVDAGAICGVSYGGLIAAAFAARYPERVSSLILVSAMPPTWTPNRRVRFYLRAPRLLMPLFMLASLRMYREIAAASGGALHGVGSGLRHARRVLTHMFSPGRMARRVTLLSGVRLEPELAAVNVPTLIVTGEAGLDRVMPVSATRRYAAIWPHARIVTLERTGHLGLITRPEAFARIVTDFVESQAGGQADRRERRPDAGEQGGERTVG